MQIIKNKTLTWILFGLYFLMVTLIILVKYPRFFLWRMIDLFYRRHYHFEWMGLYANYKPFRTIWHMLFVDFNFGTALLNIGGNILLFIPMGIFLPMYFKAPHKTLKTLVTCFLISVFFEVFQFVVAVGYFDVDDMILNTLGGAIGLAIYSWLMKHMSYSDKKTVTTYAPN